MKKSEDIQRAVTMIEGWVQGVGFRFFVEDQALALGLKGYAKNLSDGRVEVVVEGEPEKIERLITLLKNGPGHVKDVKINYEPATGEFAGFYVR